MSDEMKLFIMVNVCILISISSMAWVASHYVIDVESDGDALALCDEVEKKKPFMERLRERLASMVRVRKGLTVDSGAADHVMPAGWLWFLRVRPSQGRDRGCTMLQQMVHGCQTKVSHD